MPWIPEEQRQAIAMMRDDPAAAVGQLAGMVSSGPADDAARAADVDLCDRLEAMVDEGFAAGPIGLAADIVSYTVVDWGFDPASIGAVTTCVYGAADVVVPPAHGEWWAARIPAAELVVLPDVGHLVITDAWKHVLSFKTGPIGPVSKDRPG